MYEFLTLAISEIKPKTDNIGVAVMDMQTKKFHIFFLDKKDIISQTGEIFWDIGFITTMKNVTAYNGRLVPSGFVCIKDARRNLKTILEAKSLNPERFFSNDKETFAIVRVSAVKNITVKKNDDDIIQSRMEININGLPLSVEVNRWFLNKDLRWIKYWSHIYDTDKLQDKRSHYIKLLNKKNKTLYLLLYRHTFVGGSKNHWIAGMHWL